MSRPSDNSQSATDAVIARYARLSGDAAEFARTLGRPLAPCVWANPLRIGSGELAALLREEGFDPDPVGWQDGAFRLPQDARPGLSWLFRAGLMRIQEEAAMVSVWLLDPRPGERVLDLCAAPGNKTAQIALALGNRGAVVANDLNEGRLAPLHTSVARLGVLNVSTTTHSGTDYPAPDASFDRVLADVPCSGEGTIRKGIGRHKPITADFRRWLTGLQRALLRRAVDLCRPGGRIVYSTCTLAPEENELVVDAVLKERPGVFRIVPARIGGLETAPGLTEWEGRTLDPTLARAVRVWPHLSDTSGFFAVLLERTGDVSPVAEDAVMTADPKASPVLARFRDHFGLPQSAFRGLTLLRRNHQLRLVAEDHRLPARPSPFASGLLLTRDRAAQPKLSTQAAMAFGARATRNVVALERREVDGYLDRTTLRVPEARLTACDGPGRVLVRFRGFGLGLAQLRQCPDGWILESLFPKGW